jgi:carbonic anhydrase
MPHREHLIEDIETVRNAVARTNEASTSDFSAPPSDVPWVDALAQLREGNERYRSNAPNVRDFSAGRAARALSQAPFAAIVSCADSRVAPELTFDQNPGDLFVCRVAGHVVNTDIVASLEYAVGFLGTKLIFVLGHSKCGAVDASIKVLRQGAELPGHIQDLAIAIAPAVARAHKHHPGITPGAQTLAASVHENVHLQMERIVTRSAVLSEALRDGKIGIAGGIYHLDSGEIEFVDSLE